MFFGNSFASKAPPSHLSQHDQAWKTAKIALISTVLWVPVGLGMILVGPPSVSPGFLSHGGDWGMLDACLAVQHTLHCKAEGLALWNHEAFAVVCDKKVGCQWEE